MSNVHTLKNIEDRGVVGGLLGKQIPPGRRLGSIRESELEKALRGSIKSASDIANDYKDLQDIYLERVKDFNRICSGFNNKFSRLNTANSELKAKYTAEIKSLKSNIRTLNREATLAQKASSADKVQILFLETKIRELEEIDSLRLELERAKEDLNSKEYIIECMEKGIESSNSIFRREIDALYSARSKLREENRSFRDQLELKENTSSQIISSEGIPLESGGAEAVPLSQEIPLAPAIPVVASSLMSPMITYSILALLLIVVIWLVVRKWWNPWGMNEKNDRYFTHEKYINRPDIYYLNT
ncbi:unnamed protein product [Rhizophagus irregularis]|nr:unnamed protein product [Rhizophagus irregularis]